jgi:hypothetical protein
VLSSAVLGCIYEGWAKTEAEAERLVHEGEVRLESAQGHRCVTPLAALVSPRTTVIVVEDGAHGVAPAYAPLGTTAGPDLRFGTRDQAILGRLALRDGEQAQTLAAALTDPIDLLSIAVEAVKGGDDLHNRTAVATRGLSARMAANLSHADGHLRERADRLLEALAGTPLFFLTFWMASAKLMLSAAEGRAPSTLVTRMAGNGQVFGVSLAGNPGEWVCVPADAPRGSYLPGIPADAESLGAIGDSAVIDALGFGGQALRVAPEPREALRAILGADADGVTPPLTAAPHPAFAELGLSVGIDAAQMVKRNVAPIVTLGMVERTGTRGLLGRGVFRPPIELFAKAAKSVQSS